MKPSVLLTATLLLIVSFVGCNKSNEPQPKATKVGQAVSQWTSVTLHFEGFTKSKSGAT